MHPTLALIVGFQIVRRTTDYFAARPARELCYVVVDREEKYAAKSFIDTFVYRGADAVGAGTFGLAAAAVPFLAVPLCAVWLGVAIFLGGRQRRLAASSSASCRFAFDPDSPAIHVGSLCRFAMHGT